MNKKVLIIIFFFLISLDPLQSQWIRQVTNTNSNIEDIEFINRYTGWACGGSGLILKTTNGGINWFAQQTPVPEKSFGAISPVNENVIYCVGMFDTFIKSTDGGNSWMVIRNGLPSNGNSYSVCSFINENTGWFAGDASYIKKTTDGGLTFDSTEVSGSFFWDSYFKDANTGFVCGDGSQIYKTLNGGETWDRKTVNTGFAIPHFYKISFVNNLYGWVVGLDKRVFKTTNFGDSWDSVSYVIEADEPYCIRFSSLNTGWIGGSYGKMFKSTDGGNTWRKDSAGSTSGYIYSLYSFNDSISWGAGGGGKIIHTQTGGTPVGISMISSEIPEKFELHQNYPNPFNPVTNINYSLRSQGYVKLVVFNSLGKEITTPVNSYHFSGSYNLSFDASQLSSGIYYYQLILNGQKVDTKKMCLIK